MAYTKVGQELGTVRFVFDDDGAVRDVVIKVRYSVANGEETIAENVPESVSIWGRLTPTQQNVANTIGRMLRGFAQEA